MRLTLRLVTILTLTVLTILAIDGQMMLRREVELFEGGMRRDAQLLGAATARLVALVHHDHGIPRALAELDAINHAESHVQLRWVWRDELTPADAHAADGGRFVQRIEEPRGLVTYVPIPTGGARAALLELTAWYLPMDRYMAATRRRVIWLSLALALASGLMATLLGAWLIGRPIHRLLEKLGRIGDGDLGTPIELPRRGELTRLAGEVNVMCARLAQSRDEAATETRARIAALKQLRHADRLSTVGRLASGLAHEIGTPLNIVSGRAGLIRRGDLSSDEAARSAGIIISQVDRITTLIRQLLDFARRQEPRQQPTELRQLARRVVGLLQAMARSQQASVALAPGAALRASVDPGALEQVLMNLVVNAIQAVSPGGQVTISIETTASDAGPVARIDVCDDGAGIDASARDHLFEPFYTTKAVGQGTGLGLSIANGIVREHDGWIDVCSEVGRGSTFSIHLPLEASA